MTFVEVALKLFKLADFRLFKVARVLATVLALTEALALTATFAVTPRIDAIFSPLESLATLAFFAVFKVLIRDFFWIDIRFLHPHFLLSCERRKT
jgi:hypothetical protein